MSDSFWLKVLSNESMVVVRSPLQSTWVEGPTFCSIPLPCPWVSREHVADDLDVLAELLLLLPGGGDAGLELVEGVVVLLIEGGVTGLRAADGLHRLLGV